MKKKEDEEKHVNFAYKYIYFLKKFIPLKPTLRIFLIPIKETARPKEWPTLIITKGVRSSGKQVSVA